MEPQNQEDNELEIINLAINIFQNVGIKRWIDQIQVLKNEQIYFEICKIIFPETIIHLFRLTENREMSTGDKIQGVIDLIAKLIKNDLYHISGQAIAEGKIVHLKNFLQLLQALSSSMMLTKDNFEVESAPQNDQSVTYDDHHSYYTVIGIDKEFQKIQYSDEGDSQEQLNNKHQDVHPTKSKIRAYQNQEEEEESQDEFPIRSKIKRAQHSQKGKNSSKQVRFEPPNQKVSNDNKKSPSFVLSSENPNQVAYPIPLNQKKRSDYEMQNRKWVKVVSKMNDAKLNLQSERMQKIKNGFFRWQSEFNQKSEEAKKQVEEESQIKKRYINEKIDARYEVLNSLKGEQQAAKVIQDLFKQQRKVKMEQRRKMQEKQRSSFKKVMNFRELDDLLRQAVMSNKSSTKYRQE